MGRATASFRTIFAAATLALAPLASADTLTWPGSPGCTGTLQACIDASNAGDTIEIATESPVDENLALGDHSLTLTAAAWQHPSLAAGRSIDGTTSGAAGNVTVSISKLRIRDGSVRLTYFGSGTATYDVRELDIVQSPTGASSNIRVATLGGTVNATVYHNRIRAKPASLNSGLIELATSGATMNAYAAFNTLVRTETGSGDGGGIFVDVTAFAGTPGGGWFAAFGNEIRGAFNRSGIFFSEGLFSPTASAFSARAYMNSLACGGGGLGQGVGFVASNGSIDLQALNNTVTGCYDGISALTWDGGTTAAFTGTVWNNLLVGDRGLEFGPAAAGVVNDYNLINAGFNSVALGPHTITAPAQLSTSAPPRLGAGSPAIDAADGTTLANGIVDNGFPILDADGLRRVKLGGADIGAYEYGDVSFEHTASAANSFANVTVIDDAATNGDPGALVFPTRRTIYGLVVEELTFGIWYSSPSWTVYYENFTLPMDVGARWNAFVPAAGAGTFVHTGDAGNTTGASTVIDNPATDALANRILLVRHDWTRDGTYLDHPVGVFYTGSGGAGRWNIGNVDGTAMPVGMGFDVYAQPPSPNAFRLDAPTGAQGVLIDHPLINGVACADVHVMRVFNPASGTQTADYDVEYIETSGMWSIASAEAFFGGTAFNVVIDPAQVEACNDRIFADGFE
ncbi:MAG TPA: choice-of-anchor Q domain-containing protein [Rhodanobacteraceae bacterium]|nr:choice-of-anchor Q domain-containing protein [Rhodanobacteraceae bacterium]